ncbi:hypothetical protein MAUB1S_01485 [Mycolicibacterium aubagnense]
MDYLQTIDPCGFVDEDALRKSDFRFTHYGYRASAATGQYNSCQINTASGATVTLLIDDETPYREADDTYMTSGMTFKKLADSATGPVFAYVGYLGLDKDVDAPRGEAEKNYLKNMKITVMASTVDGTGAMELATFAADMVAKGRHNGVPKISRDKANSIKGFDINPCSFTVAFSRHELSEGAGDSPYPHYCRYYAPDKKTWLALQFHPVDIHDRRWSGMTKRGTPAGDVYVDENGPQHQVVILLGDAYQLSYLTTPDGEKLSQVPALSVSGGNSSEVNSEIAQEVFKSLPS